MSKTGIPFKLNGEHAQIGAHIADGVLATVYEVVPASHNLVIKVARDGAERSETDHIQAEYDLLVELQAAWQDNDVRRVLPANVTLVELPDGEKGLILERVDGTLSVQHYRTRLRKQGVADWECERNLWVVAQQYARFVSAFHTLGYTCNDRKLDDFYYFPDDDRLVVLDWNVVERIDQSAQGKVQDIRFFASAWFELLGGRNEANIELMDRNLAHLSVASREFFWRMLTPHLRQAHVTRVEDSEETIGAVFEHDIAHIVALLSETRRAELTAELHEGYSQLHFSEEYDYHQMRRHVLPMWKLADALNRQQPNAVVVELYTIEDELRAAHDRMQQRIQNALGAASRALDIVNELLEERETHQSDLESWKKSITDILQAAIDQNVYSELIEDLIGKIETLRSDYEWGFRTTSVVDDDEQRIAEILEIQEKLLREVDMPEDSTVWQALINKGVQLRIYQDFLKGERALAAGEYELAMTSFVRANEHLMALTPDLRVEALHVLPSHPWDVIKAMQEADTEAFAVPPYARNLIKALADGNIDRAFEIYNLARHSTLIPATHLDYLRQWLYPFQLATELDAVQTLGDWQTALDGIEQLVLLAPLSGEMAPAIRQALERISQYFDRLHETLQDGPSHRSEDEQARRFGHRLLRIWQTLDGGATRTEESA